MCVRRVLTSLLLLLTASVSQAAVTVCAGGDTVCLIGALGRAQSGGSTTIILGASTYTLTQPDHVDSEGATGLPTVTARVVLQGAGADATILERAPDSLPFRLLDIAEGAVVILRNLTLQGGSVDLGLLERGGGIRNLGALTLDTVVLRDHQAEIGGAIFSRGTLRLRRSAITDSYAQFVGAALAVLGPGTEIVDSYLADNTAESETGLAFDPGAGLIVIRRSVFAGNVATLGSGGGAGGVGTLLLEDVLFLDNQGGLRGGALALDEGQVVARRSVFAGNSTPIDGGAIQVSRGEVRLERTAVIQNAVQFGAGGGVNNQAGLVVLARATLLANQAPTGPDCAGTVRVLRPGVLGDPSGCTVEGDPGSLALVGKR